jgi:hypothetical protein
MYLRKRSKQLNSLLSTIHNKSSRTFYFALILPISLCLLLTLFGCNVDQWDADNKDVNYNAPYTPDADLIIPIGKSTYISWADVNVDFIAVLEDHLVISDLGTLSGFAKVQVQLNYGTFRDNVVLFVNSNPYSYQFMYNNNIYLLLVKNLIFENNNYSLVISFIEKSPYGLQ